MWWFTGTVVHLINWLVGVLVHWCSVLGTLVHLMHCFIDTLVYQYIGSLMNWFNWTLIHWNTTDSFGAWVSLMHWFFGALVHRYTMVHRFTCSIMRWFIGILVHWYAGSWCTGTLGYLHQFMVLVHQEERCMYYWGDSAALNGICRHSSISVSSIHPSVSVKRYKHA